MSRGGRCVPMLAAMSLQLVTHGAFPARHGFSTRTGGVSTAPWSSLNLGGHVGDRPEDVAENIRRLREASELPLQACLEQVHGDVVHTVEQGRSDGLPLAKADALVTRVRGVGLWIGIADCLPLLLVDPEAGVVGAAHAGWRGALARIGERTVERMVALGATPSRIHALIGPHIRIERYEVDAELAARFEAAFGTAVVDRTGPKPHLSLAEAVKCSLQAAGLASGLIHDVERCTAAEPESFFSHRRDQGRTGRMAGFVGMP